MKGYTLTLSYSIKSSLLTTSTIPTATKRKEIVRHVPSGNNGYRTTLAWFSVHSHCDGGNNLKTIRFPH
jgi:hypothetical protein